MSNEDAGNQDPTVDIKAEFAILRELLGTLAGSDTQKIANALSVLKDELERPDSNKEKVGRALEQAFDYSKEISEFSQITDSVEPHVKRIVDWLGSDWLHIYNLLRSKELGKKFPIVVEEYDPRWVERYQEEAQFLTSQFGPDVIVRTEHFGSTAVAGLAAKPVIDILVEVTSFEAAEREMIPQLTQRGYVYFWRSDCPPGHLMFVKGYGRNGYIEGVQRYHLHMAPDAHPLWDRLLFRDYLRKYPETAKRYEKLKYKLANRYPHDREAYTNGKAEFVKSITEKAKRALDTR